MKSILDNFSIEGLRVKRANNSEGSIIGGLGTFMSTGLDIAKMGADTVDAFIGDDSETSSSDSVSPHSVSKARREAARKAQTEENARRNAEYAETPVNENSGDSSTTGIPDIINLEGSPAEEVNPVSQTAADSSYSINLNDPYKAPIRIAGASYIDNNGNERRYTRSQANRLPAGASGYGILGMMYNHRMMSTPEYEARRKEYRNLVRSGDPAAIRAYEDDLRAQFDAGTTLDFDQTREAQRRRWAQQEYQSQKQTQEYWAANNVATPYSRAYNRSQQQQPAQQQYPQPRQQYTQQQYPQSQQQPYQNAGYTPGAGNPTAQSTPQQSIYLNSAFSQFNPAGDIGPATWSGDNPATIQDYANQFNTISTWAVNNGVDPRDMLDMRQNHQNMIRAGRMSHTDAINNMNSWAFYRQMQPYARKQHITTGPLGTYYPQNAQVNFYQNNGQPKDWYNMHYGKITDPNTQTPIKNFDNVPAANGSFGYNSTGVSKPHQ